MLRLHQFHQQEIALADHAATWRVAKLRSFASYDIQLFASAVAGTAPRQV